MTIIVQFSDSEKTKIISWFGSMPPFPEQFKNLGDVKADDPKWKDYYDLMSQFTPDARAYRPSDDNYRSADIKMVRIPTSPSN